MRLGVPDRGAEVMAALRLELGVIRSVLAGRPRPTVLLLEWVDPPFGAGHWIPQMIEAAGGSPVLAADGTHSGALTWDAVADAAPDVVIVAPCGFGLAGAVEHARLALPHLPDAAAVWAVDGDAYIVRPGPRLVDGVKVLAEILHPEVVASSSPEAATRRNLTRWGPARPRWQMRSPRTTTWPTTAWPRPSSWPWSCSVPSCSRARPASARPRWPRSWPAGPAAS